MQATKDNVHEGSVLIADGGFTCLKDGQECVVKSDGSALYVDCDEGRHYLSGQVNKKLLTGFTLKTVKAPYVTPSVEAVRQEPLPKGYVMLLCLDDTDTEGCLTEGQCYLGRRFGNGYEFKGDDGILAWRLAERFRVVNAAEPLIPPEEPLEPEGLITGAVVVVAVVLMLITLILFALHIFGVF